MGGAGRRFTYSGLLVTFFMIIFFCTTTVLWFNLKNPEKNTSINERDKNELIVYKALLEIQNGQQRYYDISESLAENAEYATFFTHLWMAIESSGQQLPVNYISKDLAFAVGPTKPFHGYYFVDVRSRYSLPGKIPSIIDYSKQWAVAAIPQKASETGTFVFLADQSGRIFVQPIGSFSSRYPLEPEDAGWVEIRREDDLRELQ